MRISSEYASTYYLASYVFPRFPPSCLSSALSPTMSSYFQLLLLLETTSRCPSFPVATPLPALICHKKQCASLWWPFVRFENNWHHLLLSFFTFCTYGILTKIENCFPRFSFAAHTHNLPHLAIRDISTFYPGILRSGMLENKKSPVKFYSRHQARDLVVATHGCPLGNTRSLLRKSGTCVSG